MIQAQNIARERQLNSSPMRTIEDGFRRNYELGIIHGQRQVIAFPLTVIHMRDEAIIEMLNEERESDERSNWQQYDTE